MEEKEHSTEGTGEREEGMNETNISVRMQVSGLGIFTVYPILTSSMYMHWQDRGYFHEFTLCSCSYPFRVSE